MIFAYSCINSLLMCDYFLCSHTRTHVYLFIVIFSYCNILDQLDLFTCVYPCLCQQTIVYSHHYFGWPNVLRALLCFGHPTTNIIFILLFVNYYIHVMLYSWWINLNLNLKPFHLYTLSIATFHFKTLILWFLSKQVLMFSGLYVTYTRWYISWD